MTDWASSIRHSPDPYAKKDTMPEPEQADHRAEAEHWAALAAREYSRSLEHAVPAALIGILHALLAEAGVTEDQATVIRSVLAGTFNADGTEWPR